MTLICGQCSRANPPEASYCYYDGAILAGRAGGPINAGAAPFPNQFVFPDGRTCRNFDQLATACQADWSAAVSLLKKGYLGSFFGGMGRGDLAMAAQEAAQFPDLDRGLDQLLAKLPTQVLQPPKLQVEPSLINLGLIKVNEDRSSELHLTNLGMRLLYGNVTSDCKWLTLGEAPGHPEKMFQFCSDAVIPVQIRGQHLRAGNKALEGRLTVDSNGGEPITVTFKVDVPITPYPRGPMAGSVTPRQIADKAKAEPRELAPEFENGDVARWYASNGWIYPVQPPIMPGVASIQQFFEALGVAKPPKVEFGPAEIELSGKVGQTLQAAIVVRTSDKKVVYGWATCDQSWVVVGKTKLTGKVATIPITVHIPSPSPPKLKATIHLVGNGNQKGTIPLKVRVAGGKAGVVISDPADLVPVEIIDDALVVVPLEPAPLAPVQAPAASPFAFDKAPVAVAVESSPFALPDAPLTVVSLPREEAGELPPMFRVLLHLIPLAILLACLLGLLIRDLVV